jgi:hypothetical protein
VIVLNTQYSVYESIAILILHENKIQQVLERARCVLVVSEVQ